MENGILLNPGTIKAGAKLQRRHPPSFLYPAECVEKGRATTPASFSLIVRFLTVFLYTALVPSYTAASPLAVHRALPGTPS